MNAIVFLISVEKLILDVLGLIAKYQWILIYLYIWP